MKKRELVAGKTYARATSATYGRRGDMPNCEQVTYVVANLPGVPSPKGKVLIAIQRWRKDNITLAAVHPKELLFTWSEYLDRCDAYDAEMSKRYDENKKKAAYLNEHLRMLYDGDVYYDEERNRYYLPTHVVADLHGIPYEKENK